MISKKNFLFFITLFSIFTSNIGCTYNPLKKYAKEFDKVVWVSTNNSSIDMKMYILDKKLIDVAPSLCIVNKDEIDYYLCGHPDASFYISKVDAFGKQTEILLTEIHYLEDEKYKSKIQNFCIVENDHNVFVEKTIFYSSLDIKKNDYIELEMKEFDQEKEATPLMFSNVKYVSDLYNFETYSRERGNFEYITKETFFVSYGSMLIDNVKTDIALKFLPENKFFIFRNDDIEDIIISGTYTNSWTDITLNFEDNKIDNNTSMKVKAEFLNNKN